MLKIIKMEKLYRKKKNGRYESVSFSYHNNELSDGIWMVQTKPGSRSLTSLFWKVGNYERPVDVVTHATMQTLADPLTDHLRELANVESEAYKSLEKRLGGYLGGAVNITNIAVQDLASEILRRISEEIELGHDENI
jgi:hypothetical protein